MKKIIAILALTLASSVVNAANYTFTVSDGFNIGNGSLVANPSGHATSGSLTMTSGSITGNYNLFAGGSGVTTSLFGAFLFNNNIFPSVASAPTLDWYGLLFVGSGLEINIWGNGAGNPYSFWSHNGSFYNVQSNAATFNLQVEPVPVPAAVWLFGSALIGMFGFGKRSQDKVLVS